ncbi:putative membrane protein [Micromonospora sp. A200]|uniref:DUF2238 domain-containing protein n=1 Tax=Micromonospora sp. A200 TaxID=2940568 RepID=UPI0024761297|nr:DUF2238 domain-containing protein [Micromonospora sp. A200]MDH6463811.1 putative membrane protein [Micromonospora sp. A200]
MSAGVVATSVAAELAITHPAGQRFGADRIGRAAAIVGVPGGDRPARPATKRRSPVTRARALLPPALLGVVLVALVVSGIRPYDRLTWLLETVWVIVGIPVLLLTWRRFPLTTLLCCLLAAHAIILIVGGHHTYARTPVGNWVRDLFDLSRNPYDRLGHFAQGFVPAILVREILVRRSPLRGSRWLAPLVVCACLAFSALFEMFEWWSAVVAGSAADDFLATQGDVWDTQWDMFLALVGAITSLALLSRLHDRQLPPPPADPRRSPVGPDQARTTA